MVKKENGFAKFKYLNFAKPLYNAKQKKRILSNSLLQLFSSQLLHNQNVIVLFSFS